MALACAEEAGVVERGGGGGGDTAEVGEWWWWSRTNEFVCSRCVCAFPANAAYAAQYKDTTVSLRKYII